MEMSKSEDFSGGINMNENINFGGGLDLSEKEILESG